MALSDDQIEKIVKKAHKEMDKGNVEKAIKIIHAGTKAGDKP